MKQDVFQMKKDYQARMEENSMEPGFCWYLSALRDEMAYRGDICLEALIFSQVES